MVLPANGVNSKKQMLYINPDNFLGQPRIWTPERSEAAWEKCYSMLSDAVSTKAIMILYIVFGVQGAGKTCWIRRRAGGFFREPSAVFDAALPAARHRRRAIGIAWGSCLPSVGVWVDTPLDVAYARNERRPVDERVPREAISSVHEMLEPPTLDEGFSEIYRVDEHNVLYAL